jgi:hypothetical protein
LEAGIFSYQVVLQSRALKLIDGTSILISLSNYYHNFTNSFLIEQMAFQTGFLTDAPSFMEYFTILIQP